MRRLDRTTTLYSKADAIKTAAVLNATASAWNYRPVHDPAGNYYSFIEIYDENGDFVAKM